MKAPQANLGGFSRCGGRELPAGIYDMARRQRYKRTTADTFNADNQNISGALSWDILYP